MPTAPSAFLRRRVINPTLPKEVKAWREAPWGRRKSPGTETHSARSVPQITWPAEVLPDTWRGVRPIVICGIWCTPHLTGMYGTRPFLGGTGRRAVAHTRPEFAKNTLGPVGIPLVRGASGAGQWTQPPSKGGKSLGGRPPEAEGNLQVPRHTRPDPSRR